MLRDAFLWEIYFYGGIRDTDTCFKELLKGYVCTVSIRNEKNIGIFLGRLVTPSEDRD